MVLLAELVKRQRWRGFKMHSIYNNLVNLYFSLVKKTYLIKSQGFFLIFFNMSGKNRISDAERLKPISVSYSIPQKTFN